MDHSSGLVFRRPQATLTAELWSILAPPFSFFAPLDREVLNRRRFHSQAEARMAIFQWLEGWYNPHRRHSALGYRSPINYERRQLPQSA